jgi:hypothetical protein
MSQLRGDNDLFSLMDQMSAAQGYADDPVQVLSSGRASDNFKGIPARRVRLTSEVPGYPLDQAAGSTMIWNPYTKVSAPANPQCIFPPTNPQVEVFRRRAYERFKSEFKASLDRISVNATAKVGPNNLWSELSPVGMMERWHFDAKLQDLLNGEAHDDVTRVSFDNVSNFTTFQIKTILDNGGTVDPILISTDKTKRKRKRGDRKVDSTSPPASFCLLADEVKFEWTRTWKRIGGDTTNDSDLKQIFGSKKFRKKLSRFMRSVMEAANEVEVSFYDQVSKRAALEAQLVRPSKKSSIPKIVVEDESVFVKFSGLSFKLNIEHYRKLQVMFDRMHSSSGDRESHESAFSSSLFCLLCRYDMLQGAGLQSSMHGSVFDVLLKHYNCRLECFASPLNSRYERYCSAFYDTDAAFGSVGSFFDYDFSNGGCYQANPPFATSFIKSMHDTMNRALQSCEEPLMFVVFVPTWKDTPGWNLLNESTFLSKHLSLTQSSHYYCEGTQHRRKDRYRVASFDTSVFILQNKEAASKWMVEGSHVDDLKAAFSRDPTKVVEKESQTSSDAAKHPKNATSVRSIKEPRKEAPHIKSKKISKRKAKRKLLVEGEEGIQQLDILHSLGITEEWKLESSDSKEKRRRKKPNR